jgi:hypothetical protein
MDRILDVIDAELEPGQVVNCGFSLVCLGLSEMPAAQRARILAALIEEVERGVSCFDAIKLERSEYRALH